jgi:hypothetical protein
MMQYTVYYMKPECFRTYIFGETLPQVCDLDDTHIKLGEFAANDMEDLFIKLQGENWSPNGEARDFIRGKGLAHTSMSVGDVIVEPDGTYYSVGRFGFVELIP